MAPRPRDLRTFPPVRRSRWTAVAVLLGVMGTLLVACSDGSDAPPATSGEGERGPVEIHVRWHVESDLPATVTVHEPPPGQALYEVHTYAAGEPPEAGALIEDGVLHAPYGEPRRFIAVVQNESDAPLRFWVTPHLPVPHLGADGLLMFCLCTGESYEVPAGGTWTRVMEFGVTRRAGLQGPVTLTHVLIPGDPPGAGPTGAAD
ncbi:MAG: hypothetical protein AMXMBFR23_20440 [Chloroflexota bacterium]